MQSIMDYACARMFLGEGKVGCNILYWEILTKTKAVCTHRMVDDMIQMGLRWWRFEKCRDESFGDPNIGNQDIKTHFLSFRRALEDRKFMACSETNKHIKPPLNHPHLCVCEHCTASWTRTVLLNEWSPRPVCLETEPHHVLRAPIAQHADTLRPSSILPCEQS